jgi:hypothetical protein
VSFVARSFVDTGFSASPMKTPKQVVTHKPTNSFGPRHPKESGMFRRIPWQDVCKFLAGAFLMNVGILFYLYLARVSVPLLGTTFIETPEISGMRSIVHVVLFLTFFYLGFIRKWKRHSITTYDQDNEKIREVVTTWMRATADGFKSHSGGRGFPLAGSAADARTRSFCGRPPFGPWASPY